MILLLDVKGFGESDLEDEFGEIWEHTLTPCDSDRRWKCGLEPTYLHKEEDWDVRGILLPGDQLAVLDPKTYLTYVNSYG